VLFASEWTGSVNINWIHIDNEGNITIDTLSAAKNGKGTFTTSLVYLDYDPEVELEPTPIVKKTINAGTRPISRVITLNFKSPLPDKKILVQYKLTEKVSQELGWVSLEAATLQ